jgi:hypothetical protein
MEARLRIDGKIVVAYTPAEFAIMLIQPWLKAGAKGLVTVEQATEAIMEIVNFRIRVDSKLIS